MNLSDRARRAALLAVAGGLAAALAATARRSSGDLGEKARSLRARLPGGGGSGPEVFECRCGASYRVSGAGRHRVYWPAEAPDDQPVLGDRCPACDTPLPASPASPVVA